MLAVRLPPLMIFTRCPIFQVTLPTHREGLVALRVQAILQCRLGTEIQSCDGVEPATVPLAAP